MLWRVSAALTALYLMHGAEIAAPDRSGLAAPIGPAIAEQAVRKCLDHADLCRRLAASATGLLAQAEPGASRAEVSPGKAPSAAAGAIPAGGRSSRLGQTGEEWVAAQDFPLPPVRRFILGARKGD